MAITLVTETLPQRVTKAGSGVVVVTAGQSLKIETTPAGEEMLDAEVPAGKVWTATVSVHVVETDA